MRYAGRATELAVSPFAHQRVQKGQHQVLPCFRVCAPRTPGCRPRAGSAFTLVGSPRPWRSFGLCRPVIPSQAVVFHALLYFEEDLRSIDSLGLGSGGGLT